MKSIVLILNLFLISAYSSMLLTKSHIPAKRTLTVKKAPERKLETGGPKDPRKLLLSFYWNSNEKRYVQRERMKELMKNNIKNLMERYQVDAHLDQWNHETIEDIHRQYNKAKSNIQLAKHFLLEKMDNIYNNFVQPARWFY